MECAGSAGERTVTAVPVAQVGGSAIGSAGRLVAGRYRLWSILGRGGMGLVWLAEDELLERPVALKQLVPSHRGSPGFANAARLRALGEARAAARVHHDGAVRIYDIVKDDGRPWIVMEPLSGRTLAEAVEAEGRLPIGRVTAVGLCLLDALRAIHQAGVVHRDVKPSNVHLCDGGRVVLTDFGIAYSTEGFSCPTETFAGSPAYISPEQLRGDRPEPAGDLFSLGATLFMAVEGRPPFDKGDLFATLAAVVDDPPAPFLHAGPLRPVIEGLLAKESGRRLGVDEAQAGLEAIQRAHPGPLGCRG